VRYARADPGWSLVAGKPAMSPLVFLLVGSLFTAIFCPSCRVP
jgi:hypothetical protein